MMREYAFIDPWAIDRARSEEDNTAGSGHLMNLDVDGWRHGHLVSFELRMYWRVIDSPPSLSKKGYSS
jgi:hypothetical protein